MALSPVVSSRILLIDIGNSCLKWGYAENGDIDDAGSAPRGDVIPIEAQSAWTHQPPPQRVLAANVASAEYGETLSRWVRQQWHLDVEFAAATQGAFGVELAYEQPEMLGVDRWLALIAARAMQEGAVCVIDCGTAVTIDALTAEGRHLGGVIFPGLALMKSSLLQRAQGVLRGAASSRRVERDVPLGRDTQSGIDKGALSAVVGGIVHTLSRLEMDVRAEGTRIITGGDASVIMAELRDDSYCYVPDLILRGLLLIAANETSSI